MGANCFRSSRSGTADGNNGRDTLASDRALLALAEISDSLERRSGELNRNLSGNEAMLAASVARLRSTEITRAEYARIAGPIEAANLTIVRQLASLAREITLYQYQENQIISFSMQSDNITHKEVVANYMSKIPADENQADRVNERMDNEFARLSNYSEVIEAHVSDQLATDANAIEIQGVIDAKLQAVFDEIDDVELLQIEASAPDVPRPSGSAGQGYRHLAHDAASPARRVPLSHTAASMK